MPTPAASQAPAVTVHVPSPLREQCAGATELAMAGTTVRDLLGELERRHPSLYRSVCDETGVVRRHMSVFVNTSHIRDRDGLDTVLERGDVVSIMTAVSGG